MIRSIAKFSVAIYAFILVSLSFYQALSNINKMGNTAVEPRPSSTGQGSASPAGTVGTTSGSGNSLDPSEALPIQVDSLERVDDEYEAKMAAFEVDCNDGKGEPVAVSL